MAPRVALRDLIAGMQSQSDTMTFYLHVQTGEVVPVSEEDLFSAEVEDEPGEQAEWEVEARAVARAAAAGEGYIALPDRLEIDEYRMMERFARGVRGEGAGARLLRAIQGRGAFRYFRDTVRELGLADEWHAYRDRAYEEIAIAWCEENGIEYTREAPSRHADA
jgi:hypothetical protein